MRFILCLAFFIFVDALAQQTVDKIKVKDLELTSETASRASIIDSNKKVKSSSSVTQTELEYLDGVTSAVQTQINSKAADSDVVKLTGDQSISGVKTHTGKIVASSTANGFRPCPSMTQAQRDATSPSAGDCVYNSTNNKWNIYNGTAWKEAGGGAGGTRLQLMADPSFEDGVTEGTCTTCTATSESSVVQVTPYNEKSLKISLSASAGYYSISKSTSAQFSGSQGFVRCQIKTNQAGVEFNSYVNGVETSSIPVVADSIWRPYEIPIVHGSASAGFRVEASSSITGDIHADECAVVVGEVGLEVAQAQLAGESYIAGTTNSAPTRTSTTLGAFSDTDTPGPTVLSSSVCTWATTDNNTIRQDLTNCPPGKYVAVWVVSSWLGTAGQEGSIAITDGTTTKQAQPVGGDSANTADSTTVMGVFDYATTFSHKFEVYGQSSSGTININNGSGTGRSQNARFTLYYYPPASKIYSQDSADTDWVSCGLTTADFTGFGTVSSIEDQCQRQGSDLLVRLKFVAGTTTATEARVNLKLGGVALTSAGTSVIPSLQLAGDGARSVSTNNPAPLIEPSVAYLTFGLEGAAVTKLSKAQGSSMVSSGQTISLFARIPINGWVKNQITGTFANVMTTGGVSKPTLVSASIDASEVITENDSSFITSCTNADPSVCTVTSSFFTADPKCWAEPTSAGLISSVTLDTTSSVTIDRTDASTPFKLFCHGAK
jgi:hypothetical protein